MIKKFEKQEWRLNRLLYVANALYLLFIYFAEFSNKTLVLSGLIIVVLNAILIFNKIKSKRLVEQFVDLLIINLIIGFIIYFLRYHARNAPAVVDLFGYFLILLGLTAITAFLFSLVTQITVRKKFQLVFNIFVTIFIVAVSVILYRTSFVNNQLIRSNLERLQLVESRFGGEKNLRCTESETVNKVRKSVVRIIGGEAEGSGFSVNNDGFILTNFHVIEFEPAPRVMFADNSFELAEIIYGDKNADLAVLRVEKKIPAIDWGNSDEVEPAEEMLSFGFPFGGTLGGEATVKKGYLSAKRNIEDQGVEFLQTDATINPGMSGGPMTTVCGKFVGINTLGTAGMGMAISSNSFKSKYLQMKSSNEPLKDIVRVEFKPDESPVEAVRAFYNYIKIRKLDKAFALLGEKFTGGMTFENWKKGYAPNLDTSVIRIEKDKEKENVVNIKLATKDLINGQIIYKFFEGWWEIKEINGHLSLWWPDIHEVKDPGWLWFYE